MLANSLLLLTAFAGSPLVVRDAATVSVDEATGQDVPGDEH